jgi:hypothetical protein
MVWWGGKAVGEGRGYSDLFADALVLHGYIDICSALLDVGYLRIFG